LSVEAIARLARLLACGAIFSRGYIAINAPARIGVRHPAKAFADILFAPVTSLPDSGCVLMISALDLRQSGRKCGG
jgi:hypothetical protein